MSLAALMISAAPAFAADMPVKAMKAPVAAPSPWDVAFGTAFTTDYNLRGVSQSNYKPAVQGYFEIDYTATDWVKFYAGVWGSSLWTGLANAEFDITTGARFTFGNFGLDLGYINYQYPGGVFNGFGNYGEVYAKPSYKFNDWLAVGGVFEYGRGDFNGKVCNGGCLTTPGVWVGNAQHYYYSGNATVTLPQWMPWGITTSINGEVGYEFYSSGINANLGYSSDTYWDVGLVFNLKAVTLDLRYWDTNIRNPTFPVAGGGVGGQCINTGNAASNFCSSRFVATLKFDTTWSALK
jgi:uncharacterized protein (TIGR02001 family)